MNTSSNWIDSIFDAKQAKNGGIVRRAIASVRKFASEDELIQAVADRGFHLVRTERQFIIFCNSGTMKLIV